jgi:hypothetical protein
MERTMPANMINDEAMRLVSLFLHDEFPDLLAELPDAYFDAGELTKQQVWLALKRLVLFGERDVVVLARRASEVLAQVAQVTA